MSASDARRTSASFGQYLAEIRRIPLLDADEERDLARRARLGEARSLHRLASAHLRFVVALAHRHSRWSVPLPDLVQEGSLGLLQAARHFDPERGVRFLTYAAPWIRSAILGHLMQTWSLVRIGTTGSQRRLFFGLGRAQSALEREEGTEEPASDAAVATRLGVEAREVRDMRGRLQGQDLSMDWAVEDGVPLRERLPDQTPGPEEVVGGAEERQALARAVAHGLARLDRRERFVVEARWMRDPPLSVVEIAARLGVSRERAWQLEQRSLAKLEASMAGPSSRPPGRRPAGARAEVPGAPPRGVRQGHGTEGVAPTRRSGPRHLGA